MRDSPRADQPEVVDPDTLLILIPAGRDAEGAASLLGRHGVACRTCPDLQALCAVIGERTGTVLVADDALAGDGLGALGACVNTQPPWSDLPFIILTRSGAASRRALAELHLPEALGNVVFLEYPLNALSLVSAVQSCLRARRRQRQVSEHLAERTRAEERLRLAQRAGGVGTFEYDAVGRTVVVSDEFCRLYGLPPQDAVPLDLLLDLTFSADRGRADLSHPPQPGGEPTLLEYRILRADTGEMRWLACRAEMRPDTAPGDRRFVGVIYDIIDRKRLEDELRQVNEALERRVAERTAELRLAEDGLRQAQKMEALGQLTGGIAHDFNNILQGISGSLELMRRRVEQGRSAEVVRYLEPTRKAVERGAALTHRLLAFARRQALQPKPVTPDRLIESMMELIQRTVGPQTAVELRLGEGVWKVLCDPNQLESALLNLAINTRDAMPDGGRLIISSAELCLTAADLAGHEQAAPGDYVEIAFADTGEGMTPEVLTRAFEPFFTTKPLGQGTGLGLSQLYGFVRQSDGIVRLESMPGQGTTVRILLPRFLGTAELAQAATEESSGTVLVVEDEADVRANLVEAIRELGCRVLEAADGPSGLRVLQTREPVDLLVTDIGLPGLNGRQLADAARERRPDLPVVLITGYAGTALVDWQLAPGMQVLRKPFALSELLARVGELLGPHLRLPAS
jgi:PAS domain S-box-containing protein